jgi:hypothetical protein
MQLPKGKKEKVSRKRKDLLVVSVPGSSIPEPGPSSTASIDEVNIAQKEQRHITWSDMPPPAAKLKKPRTQNLSFSSSSSTPSLLEEKVLENPFPLEPMGTARPPRDQASDRGRVKPMGPSLTATGSGSGSSSNLLNTSVSVSADLVPNSYCNCLVSQLFQFPPKYRLLFSSFPQTVSSIFSTTSSVRSKSQFVLPKLKKRA